MGEECIRNKSGVVMYVYRGSRGLTYRQRKRRNFSASNCIQIITVVHVIIFNIHLSHSQNGGYFCTQYKFVSKGLQGFTVGWTHDS